MKRFWSQKTILDRCEFVAAILLTLALVTLHIVFFVHAGPLWRDEISSLTLATKPTLSEFWKSLPLDPSPASYFLFLRLWHAIGLGESDLGLRGLGLLIGLGLIGALWFSCYLIDQSPPLWPLTLFAFNPLTLEGGDSLRPYGLALIWITLAFGFIWRITFGEFGKWTILFALIGALLSVQTLFMNAFVLFAIGIGAGVVLLKRKRWRALLLVIAIGAIAALSVLFFRLIQETQDWGDVIGSRNDVTGAIAVADDAIADGGAIARWAWLVLGGGSLLSFVLAIPARPAAIVDLKRDRALFAGATMFVAIFAAIMFFSTVGVVFPRYFLLALAIIALSIHVFWSALPSHVATRMLSLGLASFVATTSIYPLHERAHMRMTNCDMIANLLEQRVSRDDLIVVTTLFYGVSFQRYYHGEAEWLAVPPVADFSLQRWDLLKQALAQPDPVPEIVSRLETVLRNGHKVFLVGKLGPPPAEQPEPLPPAPQSEFGWELEPYLAQWKSELTYWIEHHALHGSNLPIDEAHLVNPLERLGLFEVSGWRED